MTRIEYEVMMDRVLREAQRLDVDDREVVLVMSRRIYQAIAESERRESIRLLNTEPYAYGKYYGMRIGIINEPEDRLIADMSENMISPALVGMTSNPAIDQLGDVIVVSEEDGNHLYQMTSEHPVQFNDIGLTVSFECSWNPQVNIGNAIACDSQLFINGNDGSPINFDVGALAHTDVNATETIAETALGNLMEALRKSIERIPGLFVTSRSQAAQAADIVKNYAQANNFSTEDGLKSEDTKLLDEFLGSFKRGSRTKTGG